MFDSLCLGVVWKDDKIINHRSLLKVLLNPWLRLVGLQIATKFIEKDNVLGRCILMRCPRRPLVFSFKFDISDCIIEQKRKWI